MTGFTPDGVERAQGSDEIRTGRGVPEHPYCPGRTAEGRYAGCGDPVSSITLADRAPSIDGRARGAVE